MLIRLVVSTLVDWSARKSYRNLKLHIYHLLIRCCSRLTKFDCVDLTCNDPKGFKCHYSNYLQKRASILFKLFVYVLNFITVNNESLIKQVGILVML
jgi:hypothetical protein